MAARLQAIRAEPGGQEVKPWQNEIKDRVADPAKEKGSLESNKNRKKHRASVVQGAIPE